MRGAWRLFSTVFCMASRPERAFRIADRRHPVFDGTGALLNGARWNSPGRRIIYASETYEGALLEVLARTRIGRIPRTQTWIEITIPAGVSVERLATADLAGWNVSGSVEARAFGDRWHEEQRSLILIVPSVVTSGLSRSVLINQDHRSFGVLHASEARDVVWDLRLFTR